MDGTKEIVLFGGVDGDAMVVINMYKSTKHTCIKKLPQYFV